MSPKNIIQTKHWHNLHKCFQALTFFYKCPNFWDSAKGLRYCASNCCIYFLKLCTYIYYIHLLLILPSIIPWCHSFYKKNTITKQLINTVFSQACAQPQRHSKHFSFHNNASAWDNGSFDINTSSLYYGLKGT